MNFSKHIGNILGIFYSIPQSCLESCPQNRYYAKPVKVISKIW